MNDLITINNKRSREDGFKREKDNSLVEHFCTNKHLKLLRKLCEHDYQGGGDDCSKLSNRLDGLLGKRMILSCVDDSEEVMHRA